MRKVRQSVMANRSDRDPPSLNRVRGEKPTEEMRRGSADPIRASGKKAPHQRPDTKLQSACPSYPNRSLRSGRRPYNSPYDQANPENEARIAWKVQEQAYTQNAPAHPCEEEERRDERPETGCGQTPERQARPDRGPARTNGRSDDRGTCRCDGLAETFGPRRSEPAPVGGLRHWSGIDGGTEGLSARTGRGVSHVSYGNPHYGKPDARWRRAR